MLLVVDDEVVPGDPGEGDVDVEECGDDGVIEDGGEAAEDDNI